MKLKPWRALIVLLMVAAGTGGCASGALQSNGVDWVVSQEQERRTLTAQGFRQYEVD